MEHPPLRLPLGSDAYQFLSGRLDELRANFEVVKDISTSTDFPA